MIAMPHNNNLESQIIGQCVLDGRIVSPELSVFDFHNPMWRRVFRAMLELEMDGVEIDPFAIGERMRNAGAEDFDLSRLSTAIDGLIPKADPSACVRILKNLGVCRSLMRQLNEVLSFLAKAPPVEDAISRLEDLIAKMRTRDLPRDKRFVPLSEVVAFDVKPALESLEHGQTNKIPTGFRKLDIAIGGGLSPSDVVITAGLTGGGKSAFVLQLSYQIAMHGFPVAFLSGEMTNRENGLRLLSQASRFLNLNSVDRLTSAERAGLLPWADHISQLPIYFDHKTSDVKTLAAQLRALVREKGVKVLVVDYIQLLKVQKVDPKTRHERITEASQEIKRMANELEICVIEVAQFNRVGSKSDRPSMHDLEASGQLEKDASLIFLIDRDAANPQAVTLRIVKGRNSGQGKIEGIFNGANLRFDF